MTDKDKPLIEVVDLHKSFGNLEVLKGVNEDIKTVFRLTGFINIFEFK